MTCFGLDNLGLEPEQEQEPYSFTKTSRPALETTQPPSY